MAYKIATDGGLTELGGMPAGVMVLALCPVDSAASSCS